jgi:hypothetical protein
MLPDPTYPIFSLEGPLDVAGTMRLFPLLRASSKHIALFIIGDLTLHEPHPIFSKFEEFFQPYLTSLRPAMLARTFRLGGFRKPDWAKDVILLLGTNSTATEKSYGLKGKQDMVLLIIRPDGYIALSTIISPSGAEFQEIDKYLSKILRKH